jgi:phosphoribosylanthranilate isomerase
MKVKICGIKNIKAAKAATSAGADFLGLNFVPTSNRCLTEQTAKEIIAKLGAKRPKLVGVFQNQPLEFVNALAANLGLDYVQLHGDESPDYCAKIKSKIIKAFGLDSDFDVETVAQELRKYKVSLYMLDRKGRAGDLLHGEKVAKLAEKFPIILAGGLTPENVRAAVATSGHIKAIDVAGGVETNGKKDPQKVQRFMEIVGG